MSTNASKKTASKAVTSLTTLENKKGVTILPPDLSDKLKDMSDAALTAYVKERVGPYGRISQELRLALTVMKSRFKEKRVWHKKLLECGIKPGTWRQWEFRQMRQLTAGKDNAKPKGKHTGRKKVSASPKRSPDDKAALDWILGLLETFIANDSTEKSKAIAVKKIVRDEIHYRLSRGRAPVYPVSESSAKVPWPPTDAQ